MKKSFGCGTILVVLGLLLVFIIIVFASGNSVERVDNSGQPAAVQNNAANADTKTAASKELDEVMKLAEKSTLVRSYEFSEKASMVYVGPVWYTQTVAFKKDFMAKIAMLKQQITGYRHFEVRDAYSNEKVGEVTSFGGSLEVYK
ncbi:MAG: hypothetical protein A3A83_03315 [Candidatus Doudnabacteria bacterium RIFCSPLOWO2_01_FULL_48_57]|nr:MAG: hypothetical protein A2668_00760 [Candidatus Doudnabacteria bacterium RIFCSPHIGHO2_01_FULL_48_180]OGE98172.1 MAG: hypothetical protein A3A83_03315 [Candidatus Doudnabacteria bacterium RIFCSPLOWO2_01_FULL_48_57]